MTFAYVQNIPFGHQGVCRRILRVIVQGTLEQGSRREHVVMTETIEAIHSLQDQVVSVHALRNLALGMLEFGYMDMRKERVRDTRRDRFLHVEQLSNRRLI